MKTLNGKNNKATRSAEGTLKRNKKKNKNKQAKRKIAVKLLAAEMDKTEILEKENETLENKNETLENKNETLENENETLEEKNKALEKRNENLEKQNETLGEKTKKLENKLRHAKKAIECLTERQREELPVSSVTRGFLVSKVRIMSLEDVLHSYNELTGDVVDISENVIGEGSFGIVKTGTLKSLNLECAIKVGKNNLFDAKLEYKILQACSGSMYFPFAFGVLNKDKLVMELIDSGFGGSKTVFAAKAENLLSQDEWTSFCRGLAEALYFLHSRNLLHNDIKSNNILIKTGVNGTIYPKMIDMGKVTTRLAPHQYRLTQKQKIKYNKRYTYLAPELRNEYNTKTSTLTDIYSLGVVFDFVAEEDNNVLQTISKQMLSSTPNNRPNSLKIIRLFQS